MSRAIKDDTPGPEGTPGAQDLLDRVGGFRTEAFDLLDALTRWSTRTGGDSALPKAAAEMQGLVNVLGDIERLLSQQPERVERPRLTLVEKP